MEQKEFSTSQLSSASAHDLGKFLKDNNDEFMAQFKELASFDKSHIIKIEGASRLKVCNCCFKSIGQVPSNLLKKSAVLLTDSKSNFNNPGVQSSSSLTEVKHQSQSELTSVELCNEC